jgi:hypothetical protein
VLLLIIGVLARGALRSLVLAAHLCSGAVPGNSVCALTLGQAYASVYVTQVTCTRPEATACGPRRISLRCGQPCRVPRPSSIHTAIAPLRTYVHNNTIPTVTYRDSLCHPTTGALETGHKRVYSTGEYAKENYLLPWSGRWMGLNRVRWKSSRHNIQP